MSEDLRPQGLHDSELIQTKRLIRDTRSPLKKFWDVLKDGQTQCYAIAFCGIGAFIFPAMTNLFFAFGSLFFILRIFFSKRERLPFRIPQGISGIDRGDPLPGRGGYARPEGIFFMGNEKDRKRELWLKIKDILTHTMIFGTTGSGKTETLISLNFNALATGSGFFYIDPKASPKLAIQVWQLCRFCGRDDDFRVINYGTSGKARGKQPGRFSNTNNPFTIGQAESLTQILVSLMPQSEGGNAIFADNAQTLISGVMYALVCLRDKGLIKLSTKTIRDAVTIEECLKLVEHPELDPKSRAALTASLETLGWMKTKPFNKQSDSFPEQYGYAKSYFGRALSSLTDTYSHIYLTEDGEVDFNDIILQRRILVTLLPALEKASQELSSLGKICLSSLKNACAVGLGSRIEGDVSDVIESLPTDTIGIGPFVATTDEYGAIVTPGYEIIFTQGRGLGIAGVVANQDWPGMVEADKKGSQQMLANTTLKIFMKTDDESTVKLAQALTGEGEVFRSTGFEIRGESELYRDALHAQATKQVRVHLNDLQKQIEGEVHFIFRGDLIRGDTFYAAPSLAGAQLRVHQLMGTILPENLNSEG